MEGLQQPDALEWNEGGKNRWRFKGQMDKTMEAARKWLETTKKADHKREREDDA